MIRNTQFDWMRETIYEPPSQSQFEQVPQPSKGWRVVRWLAVLAVIVGSLWGFNHV